MKNNVIHQEIMTRLLRFSGIILIAFLTSSCATHLTLESVSDIYDPPATGLKSVKGEINNWYKLCLEGEFGKEGFGNYELYVSKRDLNASFKACDEEMVFFTAAIYAWVNLFPGYTQKNVR